MVSTTSKAPCKPPFIGCGMSSQPTELAGPIAADGETPIPVNGTSPITSMSRRTDVRHSAAVSSS